MPPCSRIDGRCFTWNVLGVGGRVSEVGCRRSGVGGRVSEVGGRRSEVGGRRSEVGGRRSEVGGRRSEVGGRRSEVGRRASGVGRENIFPRPSGATAAKRPVAIPHNPMTKNCKKPVKLLETGGLFYQADIAIHLCTQFKRAVIHGNVKTSQIVLVIVFPKRVV
jgi:hypothetical protein